MTAPHDLYDLQKTRYTDLQILFFMGEKKSISEKTWIGVVFQIEERLHAKKWKYLNTK